MGNYAASLFLLSWLERPWTWISKYLCGAESFQGGCSGVQRIPRFPLGSGAETYCAVPRFSTRWLFALSYVCRRSDRWMHFIGWREAWCHPAALFKRKARTRETATPEHCLLCCSVGRSCGVRPTWVRWAKLMLAQGNWGVRRVCTSGSLRNTKGAQRGWGINGSCHSLLWG